MVRYRTLVVRRMEEASVAGESPERSKQRGTPEETASESAGPVPGARNGADGAGDPRSAVARGTDGEPSASAGARGGSDTGTRVLSVREAEDREAEDGAGADVPAAEDGTGTGSGAGPEAASGAGTAGKPEAAAERETAAEPKAAAEPEIGAASAPDPAEATAPDPEPGAARGGSGGSGGPAREPGSEGSLRDAVAAWVSTADRRTGGNAGRDDADSTDGTDGTEDDAPGAGDRADGPGAKPDTDTEADAAAGSKAPPASGGAPSARDTGGGSAVAPATGNAPVGGPPAGSAPAKDTAADDRDDTDGTPLAADGPADGRNADRAHGDDEGGAGDRPAPATPGNASDGTGDVRLRKAVAAWVSTADKRPAPSDGATADTGEDADADTGTDGEGGTTGTTGSARTPGAPGPAKGTGPRTDDADGADDTDADGRDEADDATAGAPGTGDRHVDQPTAVFKTLRPSRPSVDQPTTTLKIGDLGRTAGEPGTDGTGPDEPGAGPRPAPGGDRGSRFVALKDDPATQRPSTPPFGPGHPVGPFGAPQAPQRPQGPHGGPTTALPGPGAEHTRQQPMPPKPPLDLLAELTNTPPPPETPLRTTVRRVKIWTPVVLLLVIVLGVVQSMRPLPAPALDLTAQDSFTFEGGKPAIPWPSNGQAALDVEGIGTFGSSGEQKAVPIASVAKVMTAYVVLRDHPLKSGAAGPMIGIDQAAQDQAGVKDESTVHVYQGDEISQREALEAILIASANNVARLLARWDAGSEEAFVEKMNAAAKDLGMTNTTYTDPSGLNDTTVSTAVDQVKLGKAAMKSPAFREVATMMSYDDYKGVNHPNWNQLAGHNGVVGIKTGTTTSALGNLLFAAKQEVGGETRTIVGAVVRQPRGGEDNTILSAALTSSDVLIRAAQDALQSSTILKKGAVVGYVDDGLGGRTPVIATEDVKAVGWAGLTVKLTFTADEVPHSAPAGTKVGTLTVGDGTKGAVKVPVALERDLVEPSFTDKLTRLG
ncbi:D-alanyl-D-alanine carboxypeptidase [Streptomyces sp. NPDC052077]|uniref:D-alanyl-D-alanine carboxypeptidase n=1 Tax=Streptomyces sp. NPDC052077 TaxID=3154757 RepID=UPI00341EE7E7